MKVYYFASQTQRETLKERQFEIKKILEQSGVIVISNLNPGGEVATNLLERAEELGQSVLDQMEALVIEGSGADPEIGYLLAYAVSSKKPTLYLIEKGSLVKDPLAFLSHKNIPNHILMRKYTPSTLNQNITEMLQQIETSEFAETPSIKFTLRLTPQIEQYLHWKTHNTKLTKADYLRKLIEEIIKKDDQYQKYRRKRE